MAIETTLKVNGDSRDAVNAVDDAGRAVDDLGDKLDNAGRSGREMGVEIGRGAQRAERAVDGMARAADEADGIMSRLGDGALDVAAGFVTAEAATMLVETAVEKMTESFGRFVDESPQATREAERFRAAVASFDRTFRQSAFGDGTGERAIRVAADAMEMAAEDADRLGESLGDLVEVAATVVEVRNSVESLTDSLGPLGDGIGYAVGAAADSLNPLKMFNDAWGVVNRTVGLFVTRSTNAANVARDAIEPLDGFADAIRDARRELGQIDAPPSTGRVLDFFTDAAEGALNAGNRVQAFREQMQRLTGADVFHLEGDDPAADDRAASARVEREASVLDEIKGKREEARAEEYQAMLEAQEREAQLMAERQARLDEIAMLRAEQDEERAAMAEEKAMMLQEREFERLEALAQKEEEIQQRRRDAVSAYLGGFDQQVADVLVGSQSLEEGMRAAFGGIASAAADAAMAQAGIMLFTPGGQKAAIGLFAAATAARVIASALGYQGSAAGGAGGGQTVRNTQVSVTVAGEGGSVQTGRAVAESVRDAIERGAA